jgi:hypothetical protein
MSDSEADKHDEGSPLGPLIFLCTFPQLLVHEEQRTNIEYLLEHAHILIRTWHHTSPPFCETDRRFIQVGWPFLERVWAHSCAYLALFEWYKRTECQDTIEGFVSDPINAPVLRLFRWALLADSSAARLEWPANTPRPPSFPPPIGSSAHLKELVGAALLAQFEGRVTRMFQRAAAWMILHEMAHLLAGDRSMEGLDVLPSGIPPWLVEQGADDWATGMSVGLRDWDTQARKDELTVLGIIAALVTLSSLTLMPFNRLGSGTRVHVETLTRLRRLLRHFFSEGDTAWIASSLFLELELYAQSLPATQGTRFGTDNHLCNVYENVGGTVI